MNFPGRAVHPHDSADNLAFFIRKKRVSRVHADNQNVSALLVVGFGDKSAFTKARD
jgi:hypothetical protein